MDEREVRERLRRLEGEHRALDAILAGYGPATVAEPGADEAAAASHPVAANDLGVGDSVGRMRAKKLKLRLRDEISVLESMLIPDILA